MDHDNNNQQIIINNQDIDMLNSIDLTSQNQNRINSDIQMLDSNGGSLNNDDDLNEDEENEMDEDKNENDEDQDDEDDDSFILDQDTKTPGEILDEFCFKLKDIHTTLPETVVNHYMKKTGFIVNDPKLVKIISIASQKFISEIVNDVMQHHKLKSKTTAAPNQAQASASTTGAASSSASQANQAGTSSSNAKTTQNPGLTLTLEDLSHVLTEYGINVKKPYYFM